MKLDEVKQLIREQGATDELMAEFLRSLRRVPGNWSKAQHFWLLGHDLHQSDYASAVKLIRYGLEHFADCLTARRFCYEHLGRAHQANGAYAEAKACFETAKTILAAETGRDDGSIETFYALQVELERTACTWSEDLERYYGGIDLTDGFFFDMRENAFRLVIAEYLISEHRGDEAFMASGMAKLRSLLEGESATEMDQILLRHRMDPCIHVRPCEAAFLQRIGLGG